MYVCIDTLKFVQLSIKTTTNEKNNSQKYAYKVLVKNIVQVINNTINLNEFKYLISLNFHFLLFLVIKSSTFIRHAVILGFFVWIYALCLSMPPLLGWGSYGPEAGNVSCSVSWEVHDPATKSDSYIGFLFILGLVIPVIVISSSYTAIILTLRKVRKRAGKRINFSNQFSAFENQRTEISLFASLRHVTLKTEK